MLAYLNLRNNLVSQNNCRVFFWLQDKRIIGLLRLISKGNKHHYRSICRPEMMSKEKLLLRSSMETQRAPNLQWDLYNIHWTPASYQVFKATHTN
jgi:hypothetical protein